MKLPTWSNLSFQDCGTPIMEQLLFFHDHCILILILITVLVFYLILILIFNDLTNRFLIRGHLIEIVWTLVPALILLFVAFPSIRLLYLIDEISSSSLTLKCLGHQWYWSYEYTDFLNLDYDSYIIPSVESSLSNFRLLDVDNRVVLPINVKIRALISSSDVIHSWAVPSLGLKVDGSPGRLNQLFFFVNRPGLYFGQCSEICGSNHRFIPIVIEVVDLNLFKSWLINQ